MMVLGNGEVLVQKNIHLAHIIILRLLEIMKVEQSATHNVKEIILIENMKNTLVDIDVYNIGQDQEDTPKLHIMNLQILYIVYIFLIQIVLKIKTFYGKMK